MSRFDIQDTGIQDLKVLQRRPIGDHRGYLERLFCDEALETFIKGQSIRQANHTLTKACGMVRGMHFQHPPHSEIKLVSCLRGRVFDVAVDLRQGSATFLSWHAEILDAENMKTLLIPEGFAHGFQTLTEGCEMLYFHTAAYQAEAEGGLNVRDPRLAIDWPLSIKELSARDEIHEMLTADFKGLQV